MFNSANGTETTIADDLQKQVTIDGRRHRGIVFTEVEKGPGSRKQGWQQLREWLDNTVPKPGLKVREKPGLFVFNTCRHFLRTVPVLPRDEDDPDDVDTESEDHVGDDVRYRLRQAVRRSGQRMARGLGG